MEELGSLFCTTLVQLIDVCRPWFMHNSLTVPSQHFTGVEDTVYLYIVHLRLYLNNFKGPDFLLNEAEFSFSLQHYWCSVSGHAQPLHKWDCCKRDTSVICSFYISQNDPVGWTFMSGQSWAPCFKPRFFSLALISHRFEQHVPKHCLPAITMLEIQTECLRQTFGS